MTNAARKVTIRLATRDDLPAINDIFNYYVAKSTCTYRTEPATDAERAEWFDEHDEGHPATIAEMEGEVVGWASLSAWLSACHSRSAYRFTVEDSVYVRSDMQRKGIGRALLADLIERARSAGHHSIIASISADQEASVALHEAFGFVNAAHLREVGRKFDRWLDVVYMQLTL